jgi:hypothetical protein
MKTQLSLTGNTIMINTPHLVDEPTFLTWFVALGGLVVSVLATGPKVRGFKPGRGRWILRVIKSVARLPSEEK